MGYGADSIRQKFTGYERDAEADLDFAQNRYYNFRHGRFTTVDPLTASMMLSDPQSFNRYSYCGNRPLICTDPFELEWYSKRVGKDTTYQWFDVAPGGEEWTRLTGEASNFVVELGETGSGNWAALDMYSGVHKDFHQEKPPKEWHKSLPIGI